MSKKQWVKCADCGADILRFTWSSAKKRPIERSYCDTTCKGNWQRENLKPAGVNRDWLVQKYQVEQLDCAEIGRLVGRDTKRVWEWIRDYGITIRGRGSSVSKQWANGQRQIISGWKHTDEAKEKVRLARLRDGHYPKQADGRGWWADKNGAEHPGWQGGLTPEREALSATKEWKNAVSAVWHRANAKCERCLKPCPLPEEREKNSFHIHHVIPWRYREYRCVVSNLMLLCRPCHYWVHSRRNINGEYIGKPSD